MFRTAARSYGRRVVGVVLSGNLDDGTSGLGLIKSVGGVAVAQSPKDALYSGMPSSAIGHVDVDHVLPLADIPRCLVALAQQGAPDAEAGMSDEIGAERFDELDEVELDHRELERLATAGRPSGFTCPECHGALWESEDDEQLRFRCRVGHKYTPEGLLAEQGTSVEAALWTALRALEENCEMAQRMADRLARRPNPRLSDAYRQRAAALEGQAAAIRRVLDGATQRRTAVAHRQ